VRLKKVAGALIAVVVKWQTIA